jgi:hypothetical protein
MPKTNDDQFLCLNGISGATGDYLKRPMTYAQVAAAAQGKPESKEVLFWLRHFLRTIREVHLGLPFEVDDPTDLAQTGWGIVFHHNECEKIKEAVASLFDHRCKAIGEKRTKVLEYRSGERRAQWLARYGVAAGTIDPDKVPYYLLLVGSPARIPFEFYHHLSVEYCVGWIDFDRTEDFARYCQSVIDYETSAKISSTKEVMFFAPRHSFDRATQLSADHLVKPLAEDTLSSSSAGSQQCIAERFGFSTRIHYGASATKAALTQTLKGTTSRPAFLFSASHGIGWPKGHPKQLAAQGALLCQEWPGLPGVLNAEHYFAEQDLPAEAHFHGLIAFFFACYGLGTPERDRFIHVAGQAPPTLTESPFLAALPKGLLSHRNGGALACIGHVERAWGYSIAPPNAGTQLQPFQNAISSILAGRPLGLALRDFSVKYAALSASLATMLEEISFNVKVDDYELASAWIERNDAEGYLIFGDPAVRIRIDGLARPG